MKMYIEKLTAKNIGAFDSLEVNFSPRNNIIIGPNSSGKTSILKLLCYCFSNTGFESIRFRKDVSFFSEFYFCDNKYTSGLKNGTDKDLLYRESNISRWEKINEQNGFLPYEVSPMNLFAIGAYRYFEYMQISGMMREEKGEERLRYYKENNINSLQKPSLPAIKQWMINRYFVIEKDWAEIEKNNWNILIDYLPKLVAEDQSFKFLRIERDLEPIFEFNGKECYLEELSGGFKSVISIIFSIIDWCEGTNENELGNIQNAQGTVLIDEIDAHLHPQWQLKIISHLNNLFPNIQFIVTTHSPHIISNASANEIIRIPNHNGIIKVSPNEKSYNYWEVSDILQDLMGYDNLNSQNLNDILDKLDTSLENKNIKEYDTHLQELKNILHSNDSIIKVYEIKKSKIFLNDQD